MYLERRIEAALHGDAVFDFSAIIGWKALGKCRGIGLQCPVRS